MTFTFEGGKEGNPSWTDKREGAKCFGLKCKVLAQTWLLSMSVDPLTGNIFPSTSLSIFFTILDFELISQTLNFIIIIKHWSVGLESYVEINSFPYEIGDANLYFFVVD